jgi:ligand-binding SRPBCC domain-containing protein
LIHHVEFEQWTSMPLERVFLFFADPRNLPRIMPPELSTKLVGVRLSLPPPNTTAVEGLAGAGSEVITSVRLLPPLPFRAEWVSLITEFEWNHHFADIQKKGPFRRFHHRHEFTAEFRQGVQGTKICDVIEYEVGFGWLGELAQKLVIDRTFKQTFLYRQNALEMLFGVNR